VQIPKLYTIKDTILTNYISSIKTNIDSRFLLTTSILSEPNSYQEAINSPEKDEWLKACYAKVEELEK
jgi:hypothetical protein